MGRYSTITLDECVAVAKNRLQLRTTDSDTYMMDLGNEAVRHLDASSIFLKQTCALSIEDMKAKLPCGFHSLIALQFSQDEKCWEALYADLDLINNCGCETPSNASNFHSFFQISDGWIFFHQVPDGVSECVLSFMGLNVDSEGRVVVYEDYRRAIVSYLCYSFCLAHMDENKYRAQMEHHYQNWVAQKRWIKSNDFQNDFHNQKHQIRAIMNSWLADKRNFRTI